MVEAIGVLATGRVVELHLDHDLADDDQSGLGRDVTGWLAGRQAQGHIYWPAQILLHTANDAGRQAMDGDIMNNATELFEIERDERGSKIHFTLTR